MSMWLMWLSLACVLDRTGQSASVRLQAEIRDHGVRLSNVEQQFIQVEARVNQMEDLTRSSGQQNILRMETLEELRTELARLRGEVEILNHAAGEGARDIGGRMDDAAFRVMWLESRTDQLERSLGLKTPPPPAMPTPTVQEEVSESTWTGEKAADETEESGDAVADAAPAPIVVTIEPAPTAEEPKAPAGDPVTEPALDPAGLLDKAKEQLKAGNHAGASTMLNRFLELYPNDERADEATYRRAETSMNAEDYQSAVLQFQEVIDQYKASAFASWAMLRQGECFEKQGQDANAKVFFSEVIRIWPKSRAARAAKKKLSN